MSATSGAASHRAFIFYRAGMFVADLRVNNRALALTIWAQRRAGAASRG